MLFRNFTHLGVPGREGGNQGLGHTGGLRGAVITEGWLVPSQISTSCVFWKIHNQVSKKIPTRETTISSESKVSDFTKKGKFIIKFYHLCDPDSVVIYDAKIVHGFQSLRLAHVDCDLGMQLFVVPKKGKLINSCTMSTICYTTIFYGVILPGSSRKRFIWTKSKGLERKSFICKKWRLSFLLCQKNKNDLSSWSIKFQLI